jgi:hypothetical protein
MDIPTTEPAMLAVRRSPAPTPVAATSIPGARDAKVREDLLGSVEWLIRREHLRGKNYPGEATGGSLLPQTAQYSDLRQKRNPRGRKMKRSRPRGYRITVTSNEAAMRAARASVTLETLRNTGTSTRQFGQ